MADILARNCDTSPEEVTLTLTDNVTVDIIKECRQQLFNEARALYNEQANKGTTHAKLRLKQRRSETVHADYARDLIGLFHFVCGTQKEIPTNVVTVNTRDSVIVEPASHADSNPDATDHPHPSCSQPNVDDDDRTVDEWIIINDNDDIEATKAKDELFMSSSCSRSDSFQCGQHIPSSDSETCSSSDTSRSSGVTIDTTDDQGTGTPNHIPTNISHSDECSGPGGTRPADDVNQRSDSGGTHRDNHSQVSHAGSRDPSTYEDSGGLSPSHSCDTTNITASISELILRCRDYDRVILDLQCTVSTMQNELATYKAKFINLTQRQDRVEQTVSRGTVPEHVLTPERSPTSRTSRSERVHDRTPAHGLGSRIIKTSSPLNTSASRMSHSSFLLESPWAYSDILQCASTVQDATSENAAYAATPPTDVPESLGASAPSCAATSLATSGHHVAASQSPCTATEITQGPATEREPLSVISQDRDEPVQDPSVLPATAQAPQTTAMQGPSAAALQQPPAMPLHDHMHTSTLQGPQGSKHSPQTATYDQDKLVIDAALYYAMDSSVNNLLADMYITKENVREMEERLQKLEQAPTVQMQSISDDTSSSSQTAPSDISSQPATTPPTYAEAVAHQGCHPAIPCSNRFAALADDDDKAVVDDDDEHSGSPELNTEWQQATNRKRYGKTKPKNRQHDSRIKVSIIGSSLVRGLGPLTNRDTIDAISYTNGGCSIQHIEPRLDSMARPDDDVIVLAAGTNNVPRESVATIITRLRRMIDNARQLRPKASLIVPEIPRRYDEPGLNGKIAKINAFIRHKCSTNDTLHSITHNFTREDYAKDGLHLNRQGKAKYAQQITRIIQQLPIGRR